MSSKWEEDESFCNVDHYANVSKQFRLKREWGSAEPERIIVASGSSGISLLARGHNNGFCGLTEDEAMRIAKELILAVKFSKEASSTFSEFWRAKNGAYTMLDKIKQRFK